MQILRQSTAVDVRLGPAVDSVDGVTPETGLTIGSADQAEVLRADGAATLTMAGTLAAVTGCDGWYDYTCSTTDTNTVGTMDIVIQDSSLMLPLFARFQVVEEAIFDQLYAASAAGPLQTPTIAEMVQGAPPLAPTAEEAINYLYRALVRNKMIVDTNTLDEAQIFADNDSTILFKSDFSDASSILTKLKAVSG